MIKELIATYYTAFKKSKLKLRERLSEEENFFRKEVTYYDEGRVAAGIEMMQEDYNKIIQEIEFVKKNNSGQESRDKLDFLYKRQYEFVNTIAFQGSQKLDKVEYCLSLIQKTNDDFKSCLQGLIYYKNGEKNNALHLIDSYIEKKQSLGNHYLLNKIYGILLFENNRIDEAECYLFNGTQICPEDKTIHEMLAKIYKLKGKERALEKEKKIISLLEG